MTDNYNKTISLSNNNQITSKLGINTISVRLHKFICEFDHLIWLFLCKFWVKFRDKTLHTAQFKWNKFTSGYFAKILFNRIVIVCEIWRISIECVVDLQNISWVFTTILIKSVHSNVLNTILVLFLFNNEYKIIFKIRCVHFCFTMLLHYRFSYFWVRQQST